MTGDCMCHLDDPRYCPEHGWPDRPPTPSDGTAPPAPTVGGSLTNEGPGGAEGPGSDSEPSTGRTAARREAGIRPAPEQLWELLNDAEPDLRAAMLADMLDAAEARARCFELNHERRVADLDAYLRSRTAEVERLKGDRARVDAAELYAEQQTAEVERLRRCYDQFSAELERVKGVAGKHRTALEKVRDLLTGGMTVTLAEVAIAREAALTALRAEIDASPAGPKPDTPQVNTGTTTPLAAHYAPGTFTPADPPDHHCVVCDAPGFILCPADDDAHRAYGTEQETTATRTGELGSRPHP